MAECWLQGWVVRLHVKVLGLIAQIVRGRFAGLAVMSCGVWLCMRLRLGLVVGAAALSARSWLSWKLSCWSMCADLSRGVCVQYVKCNVLGAVPSEWERRDELCVQYGDGAVDLLF